MKKIRESILAASCFILIAALFLLANHYNQKEAAVFTASINKNYIKWVDFTVTANAMDAAYKYDIETYGQKIHLNWIEMLAYYAARTGGNFSNQSKVKESFQTLAEQLTNQKTTMDELTKDLKYYKYYYQAYQAVLGGMVGEFELQTDASEGNSQKKWEKRYGLKAFSPIAFGFYYNDFDDFGVSRSYGFKRKHLGHDMMGCTGTPIIAVESGYVEALGWNQYGGWRIGIRSFDKKRYYYYAHLRKDHPFVPNLKIGDVITAGDVIGYLGSTGYSRKENVSNISTPHLHFGVQLIFDEVQKDGNNEIWVSCYELTKFLYKNKSLTEKTADGKDSQRIYQMKDPAVSKYKEKINKRKRKFFIFNFDS